MKLIVLMLFMPDVKNLCIFDKFNKVVVFPLPATDFIPTISFLFNVCEFI